MKTFLDRFTAGLPGALSAFFEPAPYQRHKSLTVAWVLLLYVLGGIWLGVTFNWGDHGLFYQDWALITAPRLQFLRDAAQTGQLPLHISDPSTLHGATLQFLAVPDTMISPQYLLMARFSLQRFQLINVLLLYSLGYVGLLLLAKRLRLSLFTLALLFTLYNFNGHILAHLSIGHASWVGYFLFSWFVLLTVQLLEGDTSWRWCFQVSFLLFVIWLQGSFHQYLWLLLFLALLAIFVPGKFWVCVRAGFFALLMSSFRILPAILLNGRYQASYMSGYSSLQSLWSSLVEMSNPKVVAYFPPGHEPLASWETTAFIGLLAAIWMVYFGVWRGLLQPSAFFRRLMLPLAALLLLSMDWVFGYLRILPIPLIQGERVGTRIFSVVLVFLLVIAAEQFQRWLDGGSGDRVVTQLGLVLAFMINLFEVMENSQIWSIANIENVSWWVYYNSHRWYVKNNFSDTLYLWLVWGGLALSLATMLGLGLAAWLERKRLRKGLAHAGR